MVKKGYRVESDTLGPVEILKKHYGVHKLKEVKIISTLEH